MTIPRTIPVSEPGSHPYLPEHLTPAWLVGDVIPGAWLEYGTDTAENAGLAHMAWYIDNGFESGHAPMAWCPTITGGPRRWVDFVVTRYQEGGFR